MKIAKQSGRNLIFMCHSILPDDVKWDEFGWGEDHTGVDGWRISSKSLKKIINIARKYDMAFYTTSELAGVATFIDPNLEKVIRNQISNPSDKWISIKEISCIKELDLSNKNISNLDGIHYLLNLETLNLRNNNITDFRLLKKLPKLKNLSIDQSPIIKRGKIKVSSIYDLLFLLGININLFVEMLTNLE
jgi:hypothetical protein